MKFSLKKFTSEQSFRCAAKNQLLNVGCLTTRGLNDLDYKNYITYINIIKLEAQQTHYC